MHNINVNYLQRAVNIKRAARRARGLCLRETLICVVLARAVLESREKEGEKQKPLSLSRLPFASRSFRFTKTNKRQHYRVQAAPEIRI